MKGNIVIREMTAADKSSVINMMRVFYASPAVHTNGSEEIFAADVDNCVGDSPYLEGYVFDEGGTIAGYAMVAKSFSTEFGCPCAWVEDIYIREEYRGRGIAKAFFEMMDEKFKGYVIRLEVEHENERAVSVYKASGFTELPYVEMVKR